VLCNLRLSGLFRFLLGGNLQQQRLAAKRLADNQLL
jgi:hypothetical protein